ncbi:poly(glycerol-phosphate) alpha-glucosyltransferase [Macrococcus armenti]|uniref:poly(glycerol-phosphate) alpha-glucosyltransferase n=1 Tax=Macrococcus armenti TaxID=2875764 RepID=UPI001CCD92C0|nr:poly(glycerol-phosphate) alpha-glucosyltransferase [Macrococcus armenti]UBH12965.1 poly(glycerol-phosphate) alpha-glucosyltransferase [Macrococcus armenti]UBH15213.1 poly(glycerol-phosphate) alpha-glucosyltransferase [Macrococcus armenti]UBH17573.1 poly(glycerol-phosphate) alpha-glucosyltransferase [Macrococcus armenti]UBH19839.1 poly(glycerol-phosphate) alpha-glucosyltransferase [Macrococcus armenti]UBH22205.1 poly(glycerol-phosphate) alpha-glucosyltransferase [Macrococcus armenti]
MSIETRINELLALVEKKHGEIKDEFYISLGKENIKADIKLFRGSKNIKRDIINYCEKFKKKTRTYPKWIKIDIVTSTEDIFYDDLKREMEKCRRNYIEYGIVLDSMWNLSFLPEVINANAFVKPQGKERILSEKNINNYLLKYTSQKRAFKHSLYSGKRVMKFTTKSFFLDENELYELEESGYTKGLRKIENLSLELDKLIATSTDFLKNEIQDNGRYIYGYFPHFDKEIGFYNTLRHSSSTYALIEGLDYTNQDIKIAAKPIEYLISNYLFEKDGKGYIFDDTEEINEIKLGQSAAFIFAICEYLKYEKNDKFLKAAQSVAEGLLSMIDVTNGDTTHVLNYPDLSVKEKFRIIYYDGEAALALLRLYQRDNNEKWLNVVKTMFEKFIEKDYWKYHDHWLGYCTNELIQINPDERYFELGIKNVSGYLDYIYQRETTFPTFLEMMMATYHLVQKGKSLGLDDLIKKNIDEEKFMKTIHKRAEYQRVGYFYPEIAMYFKNPKRILNSFFIKHHGYRVRIDDIEHYLSGYVQYQKVFKK